MSPLAQPLIICTYVLHIVFTCDYVDLNVAMQYGRVRVRVRIRVMASF